MTITSGSNSKGKITLLQKFQSYTSDVQLEVILGPPEPKLELILRNGKLMLASPTAIYSYEDRYTSFLGALKKANIKSTPPNSVLILGFGLGSIPLILERKFGLKPSITAIEIDPRIISLAKYWLPVNTLHSIDLIQADAIFWLSSNTAQFDLICIDLFIDQLVPQACNSPSFLNSVKAALTPAGQVIFSRLQSDPKEIREEFTYAFFSIFPKHSIFNIGGNDIFVGYGL
ncbi:MAG: spermidine synthase [Limisphaerales bacterium]